MTIVSLVNQKGERHPRLIRMAFVWRGMCGSPPLQLAKGAFGAHLFGLFTTRRIKRRVFDGSRAKVYRCR